MRASGRRRFTAPTPAPRRGLGIAVGMFLGGLFTGVAWDGRNSQELPVEKALEIVGDDGAVTSRRRAALTRVFTAARACQHGLRQAAEDADPDVSRDARMLLDHLKKE